MRKIFYPLVLLMIFCSTDLLAQAITVFKITYHASGNRIKRELQEIEYEPEPDPYPVDAVVGGGKDDPEEWLSSNTKEWFVTAYPNPIQSELIIYLPNLEDGQAGNLVMAMADGAIFYETRYLEKQNQVNMQNATAGYYFLRVTVGTKSEEWVIVKK